jgi:phosphoribosylanthranilate isomerase
VFVKICGITRLQDARAATDLGASAIGFVFWPGSPRAVSRDTARDIVREMGGRVKTVGVFVDPSVDDVLRSVEDVGLDVVQLHGGESPEMCREVSLGLTEADTGDPLFGRVIKAVALDGSTHVDRYGPETLILVDAHDSERRGGTGRTVNWKSARALAAKRPTILAGGLSPDNVARAIETVRPYGIDVSSGVESSPGIKDARRLKQFFEALND